MLGRQNERNRSYVRLTHVQGLVKGAKLCFRYPNFYFRYGEYFQKRKDLNKVLLLLQDLAHASIFGLCFMFYVSLPNEIKLLFFNILLCIYPFLKKIIFVFSGATRARNDYCEDTFDLPNHVKDQ